MNNIALALLPLALAYIMFTLGTGLKLSDFKVIRAYPKAFFVGLFNQVIWWCSKKYAGIRHSHN